MLITGRLNFPVITSYSYSEDRLTRISLPDGREYYGERIREVFPDAKVYDPATDTWTATLGSLGGQTPGSLTLLGDGRVLLAGGVYSGEEDFLGENYFDYILYSTTAVYDPESNFWSPGPNLAERRSDHSATLMPDGWIFLMGGIGLTEVGEGREERVLLNTSETIDSIAIPLINPASMTTSEADEDSCETIPIPAPSADLAPAGESPSPRDILSAAHAAMSALDSYHAELRSVLADDEGDSGLTICERVAIDFQAPDRIREHYSSFRSAWGEFFTTEIIFIGASVYGTDPVTGKWEWAPLPPVDSADLLEIFGDDATTDLRDASIEGIEELNNVDVYRISGTVTSQIFDKALDDYLPMGTIDESNFPLRTVFWVGVDDSLVRKVSAEGVYEDVEADLLSSSIVIEYSAFGEDIVVEAPEVGVAP